MPNMPAPNSGSYSTISTAERDWFSAQLPKRSTIHFGAGRCAWYPQNNATAATLASDKYFTNVILERAGVATLGGNYFFLHDRHRAHRPDGHEIEDALKYFASLGTTAFVKPLTGSRGDFAQAIHDEAALKTYIAEVSRYYDSILMQPLVSRRRIPDFPARRRGAVCGAQTSAFSARRWRRIDPRSSDRAQRGPASRAAFQPAAVDTERDDGARSHVLPKGERWELPGRMNLSAGGKMVLEAPPSQAMSTAARKAARALGLRVAAVDLFTNISGNPDATAVIEVNSNPSIRLLEDSGRADLILKIWHHTFSAMGLL